MRATRKACTRAANISTRADDRRSAVSELRVCVVNFDRLCTPPSRANKALRQLAPSRNHMDDAAVKAAWIAAGRPDGYRPPTEQEEKDLADSRHRGRGEKQQKKRHTSNQRELQRFLREAAMAETHRVCHPARC